MGPDAGWYNSPADFPGRDFGNWTSNFADTARTVWAGGPVRLPFLELCSQFQELMQMQIYRPGLDWGSCIPQRLQDGFPIPTVARSALQIRPRLPLPRQPLPWLTIIPTTSTDVSSLGTTLHLSLCVSDLISSSNNPPRPGMLLSPSHRETGLK